MNPHAILVDDHGALTWSEVERMPLPAGHVRVRARATAVNRADLLQRAGRYPVPKGASPILGLEVAGEVVESAPDVQAIAVGQPVCALLEGGGYAEEVIVDARMLLPVPTGLSYAEAAALPEVFYTAYLNLWIEGELREGESVLVHAAASGVGTAALQLCRAFGHRCFATTSAAKLDAASAWGATDVINRNTDDFTERVRTALPRGVDVILDPVGASYLASNQRALAPRGRLVIIGLMGGATATLDLGRMLLQRQRIVGSVLRSRARDEKVEITRRIRQSVWPRFNDRSLRPVIHATLPIRDATVAHDLLRDNATVGKVVLAICDADERPN